MVKKKVVAPQRAVPERPLFGLRVTQAMAAKRHRTQGRYTDDDLASALGLARNTIQGWRNRGALPGDPQTLLRAAVELEVSTEWLTGDSEEGGPGTHSVAQFAKGLSYRIRVWLQHELLDYAMAGATEQELDAARRLFTAPELLAFYREGAPEDDTLRAMVGAASAIRLELRKRGRKLEKAPRTAREASG